MTASAAELLGWDDIARRDLPWRSPAVTAWQILVSEFMLQQTPVAQRELLKFRKCRVLATSVRVAAG